MNECWSRFVNRERSAVDEMENISGLINVLRQYSFHMDSHVHTHELKRICTQSESPLCSFQRHINHVNCTWTRCCTLWFCKSSAGIFLLMPPLLFFMAAWCAPVSAAQNQTSRRFKNVWAFHYIMKATVVIHSRAVKSQWVVLERRGSKWQLCLT